MEKIISIFSPSINHFYSINDLIRCCSHYSIVNEVFRSSNLLEIEPYYYLPTDGFFKFTGVVFINLQDNRRITIIEAVQDGIPYYYPFMKLFEKYYDGNLNKADYVERKDGNLVGCQYLKCNTECISYKSQEKKSIEFLKELFNNTWKATVVEGYCPDFDSIRSVEKEKRNHTNWRLKKFVKKKNFYVVSRTDSFPIII